MHDNLDVMELDTGVDYHTLQAKLKISRREMTKDNGSHPL